MTDREGIYDLEPTASIEEVVEKYRDICVGSIRHIQIKGGNKQFYDEQGPRVIRDVFNLEMAYLNSNKSELGLHCAELTSKYGDLHIISEEKPVLDSLLVKDKDGKNLEVRLVVDEVE